MRPFHLALVLTLHCTLVGFSLDRCAAADSESREQQAVEALKRLRTNIQSNKDGTTRLLRLSKPVVTDETLSHLQHLKHLDYLAIVCPQITDANTAHIAELNNLDTLLLSESGIGNATLAHLRHLVKLERLYLADTKIDDDGMESIASLTALRTLSLENTAITDKGLLRLASLKNLETLLLSETRITGDALAVLADMPKIRVLFLDQTPLSAKSLCHLTSLQDLEHLSLNGVMLDDHAIESLCNMANPKVIELYRSGISASGIQALRKALPETQVFGDAALEGSQTHHPNAAAVPKTTDTQAVLPQQLAAISSRLARTENVPDFQRHVVPLLGRLGCNGRACHGSFQGQGGLRLSMFGYDFEMDRENLLERIDLDAPADSLILNKPTSADDHEGGLRLPPGGWEQQLLRRWIEAGANGFPEKPATFVRLDVTPREIVFTKAGESSQLRAEAVWSDGTREDVTCLTRFQTNDESVAEVSAAGEVTAAGKGDTYVISFYDNGVFSTQVVLPVTDQTGRRYPGVEAPTEIDQHVTDKLTKLGIVPSEVCTDEEFLRRVGLDLIGTLPTPQESAEFVADKAPDKRARKIDRLLEHPAYVTWWTQRLCDLTGSNAGYLGATEMAQPVAAQWRSWIRRRVQENVGWDRIASGILLARSRKPAQSYREFVAQQSRFTSKENPSDFAAIGNPMPHYWYRDNIKRPTDKALALGYTFMGVRLDCAQCHKHPYDQWSKRDFELFTEFFTRIKTGVAPDATALHEDMRNMLGVPVKLNTAALRRQSFLRIAAEGRSIPWNEVWIEPARAESQRGKLLGSAEIDLAQFDDPREPLVDWLLNEPNRYFAKAFVNRIWANYFNVGIVNPPDDLNLANPPSNKALLDFLVSGFVDSGYDMKWLHRTITTSHAYQRSWRPNDTNRSDSRNFSHAVFRRLPAEVAIDAIIQATASDKRIQSLNKLEQIEARKIAQHPKSYQTRAIDFSLLIFGKPLRTTNCDCERGNQPTLLQSLYVRNDQEIFDMLDRSDGWIAQVRKENPSADKIDDLVTSAYQRTFSRIPTETEATGCRQHIEDAENVADGLRELMWALLNTQEFIANH